MVIEAVLERSRTAETADEIITHRYQPNKDDSPITDNKYNNQMLAKQIGLNYSQKQIINPMSAEEKMRNRRRNLLSALNALKDSRVNLNNPADMTAKRILKSYNPRALEIIKKMWESVNDEERGIEYTLKHLKDFSGGLVKELAPFVRTEREQLKEEYAKKANKEEINEIAKKIKAVEQNLANKKIVQSQKTMASREIDMNSPEILEALDLAGNHYENIQIEENSEGMF